MWNPLSEQIRLRLRSRGNTRHAHAVEAHAVELTVVPTPGAEGCGLGDPSRRILLPGNRFVGSWTDNEQYYRRDGDTLICKSVCWLNVQASISDVPEREWEALLKFKCGSLSTQRKLICRWALEVNGSVVSEFTCGPPGERSQFRESILNEEWHYISFGIIRPSEANSNIVLKLFGENRFWIHDLHFGGFELRAVGLPWEKERLLRLCKIGRTRDDTTNSRSVFQEMPEDILITNIVSMLTTHEIIW